jgi:hypothetical protein
MNNVHEHRNKKEPKPGKLLRDAIEAVDKALEDLRKIRKENPQRKPVKASN